MPSKLRIDEEFLPITVYIETPDIGEAFALAEEMANRELRVDAYTLTFVHIERSVEKYMGGDIHPYEVRFIAAYEAKEDVNEA